MAQCAQVLGGHVSVPTVFCERQQAERLDFSRSGRAGSWSTKAIDASCGVPSSMRLCYTWCAEATRPRTSRASGTTLITLSIEATHVDPGRPWRAR